MEGFEGRLGGKVPSHCVGLTTGPRDFQPFVLYTEKRIMRCMEVPDWVLEVGVPRPGGIGWSWHGGEMDGEVEVEAEVKDDKGYVSVEEEDDKDDDNGNDNGNDGDDEG